MMELHGMDKAQVEIPRALSRVFLDDVDVDMTIYPINSETVRIAGRISGQSSHRERTSLREFRTFSEETLGRSATEPKYVESSQL